MQFKRHTATRIATLAALGVVAVTFATLPAYGQVAPTQSQDHHHEEGPVCGGHGHHHHHNEHEHSHSHTDEVLLAAAANAAEAKPKEDPHKHHKCGGKCGGHGRKKKKSSPAKEPAKVPEVKPHQHATYDGHGEGKDPSSCPFHKMHATTEDSNADIKKGFDVSEKTPRSLLSIAAEAACASIATSFIPIIVILICPLHWRWLRLFLAFASGALIADVFTHQLPSFISPAHDHSHDGGSHDDHDHSGGGCSHGHHEHLSGIAAVQQLISSPMFLCAAAMICTYLVDALVYSRMMAKERAEKEAEEGACDGHDSGEDEDETAAILRALASSQKAERRGHGHSHGGHGGQSPFTPPPSPEASSLRKHKKSHSPITPTDASTDEKEDGKDGGNKKEKSASAVSNTSSSPIIISHHSASAAIVDLFADTMHNFTDGLTLGASFLKGAKVGWHTTLLVLLHEVPHELGDGALLVRGGWTRWEAAKVQCWTGLGNLVGCMVIIFLNPDQKRIDQWVTPLVAGSFLYVALAGMLGELKEVPPLSFVNVLQLIGEAVMFLSGLAFLELVVHSGMH